MREYDPWPAVIMFMMVVIVLLFLLFDLHWQYQPRPIMPWWHSRPW